MSGGTPTQRSAYLIGPEQVEIREVAIPAPGAGELVLRVEAATTCGTDVKVFRRGGHPRMLRVPGPFGHEMAGTVAAVGAGVRELAVGDRVVVLNSAPCGACEACGRGRENLCYDLAYLNGAFSEYVRVPERFVARNTYRLPDALPCEIAALTEPLACVLHGIDACALEDAPAEILVLGGGPIGLLFVGALGAAGHRVVLADPNASRLEVGRALGAAETIPIARGGAQAERIRPAAREGDQERNPGYDVVVEATGVPEVWEDAIAVARAGGLVNLFGGCAPGSRVQLDTTAVHYRELTVKGVYHHRPATARRAVDLLAREAFPARLLLSREEPLHRLVDGLRAMMAKEALKVVIRPALTR